LEGATIPRGNRVGSKNRTINEKNIPIHVFTVLTRLHRRGSHMKQIRHGHLIITITLTLCIWGMFMLPQNIPAISNSVEYPSDVAMISSTGLFNLTFTSDWNTTPTVVNADDRVVGDRIVLNATWIGGEEVDHTRIIVNATAVPFWIINESEGSSVGIKTWFLGANHTCTLNMTAWLVNGTTISQRIQNVFFGIFFKPHIRVLSPNGGEIWSGVNNITWTAWDNNSRESLTFEVLLSADEGKSFVSLATGIEKSWYPWNCSSFLMLDTYLIEVRVSDGTYDSYDRSDNTFTVGELPTTETSTTTVITTTSTAGTTMTTTQTITTTSEPTSTELPSGSNYLLVIGFASAIIGSAVLAVVVYYLATRKL